METKDMFGYILTCPKEMMDYILSLPSNKYICYVDWESYKIGDIFYGTYTENFRCNHIDHKNKRINFVSEEMWNEDRHEEKLGLKERLSDYLKKIEVDIEKTESLALTENSKTKMKREILIEVQNNLKGILSDS